MRRALLLAILLGLLGGLAGCTQREENNPFIGPSGQANEMPWGAHAPTAPAVPKA